MFVVGASSASVPAALAGPFIASSAFSNWPDVRDPACAPDVVRCILRLGGCTSVLSESLVYVMCSASGLLRFPVPPLCVHTSAVPSNTVSVTVVASLHPLHSLVREEDGGHPAAKLDRAKLREQLAKAGAPPMERTTWCCG